MFRFATLFGEPFDLEYMGSIGVFDAGDRLIATCMAVGPDQRGYYRCGSSSPDHLDEISIDNSPEFWDSWEILIDDYPENMSVHLQRAIATAWQATTSMARLTVTEEEEEEYFEEEDSSEIW